MYLDAASGDVKDAPGVGDTPASYRREIHSRSNGPVSGGSGETIGGRRSHFQRLPVRAFLSAGPRLAATDEETIDYGFFHEGQKKTGLDVSSQRFRHTVATKLCNPEEEAREPDICGVQTLLGHTSVQTNRGYVRTNRSRLQCLVHDLELPALVVRTLSSD